MPLKLNVGLSKKLGQPDFGSIGAHCTVEIELDGGVLSEPETFRQRVRQVYHVCRTAVDEELKGGPKTNGHAPRNGRNGANGHASIGPSSKQLDFIDKLVRRIDGLDGRCLERLCQAQFRKPLAGLTTHEASRLIDRLKAVESNEVELASLLEVAA